MRNLSSTRMGDARSHYPENYSLDTPVYRNALKTHAIESSNAQTFKHPLVFDYRIGCQLLRRHYNPPVWLDSHPHRFSIEVTLRAVCHPCDLYGVDMVEAQRLLTHFAESLPEVINDSPYVPLGTTEQLCLYFFGLKTLLDRHIKIVEVSVSEETGRITSLRSSELPFRFLRMRAWMHDGLNFLQASMSSLKAFFSRKTSAILAHRMSHLSS